MRWIAVAAAVGCGGEEALDPGPSVGTSEPAAVEALAVTGQSCDPIAPVVPVVYGGQGGYHLDAGVFVSAPEPEISLELDVYVAETDERVAGTELPVFIALVDYDPATGSGWASKEAVFGDNNEEIRELICSLLGVPLRVEATACRITTGECSVTSGETTIDVSTVDPSSTLEC
jgi:hypothetical protein